MTIKNIDWLIQLNYTTEHFPFAQTATSSLVFIKVTRLCKFYFKCTYLSIA